MINNAPLVSVIIPCYNAENYVEQAVRSIVKQTYSNLEILAIDDC
jgi:glycosyltransferase involved in cell wall biosynthesis